jgi:predicted nucleic acid-binding protein
VTADTSVVVAGLSRWHRHYRAAAEALDGITALPAHVLTESYSVLTRLPGGLAVPLEAAVAVLASRFDEPLQLAAGERARLLSTLAAAGVGAGATYDGLVALEARAHERVLLTCDGRAQDTYRRLGVPFRVVA